MKLQYNSQSYLIQRFGRRPTNKRGQVALEFQMAMWIMLIFIVIILAAENDMLPKIANKTQNHTQNAINIYHCALNDMIQLYHTQGIAPVRTNGTCLYKGDTRGDLQELQGQDNREFG